MIFVDANYIVALVSTRDQHHARAKTLSLETDGTPLVTTEAVLLEVGNALARRHKAYAVAVIENAKSSKDIQLVRLGPELFDRGLELYSSHRDKAWGLVDCISFVVMRDFGVTEALTHDEHFIQAGFRALLREGP
jgi:predicted nucleic acid-binding protein